ncbi:unnamed protein product [Polarella glacialis]|uniref:Uncharacterized protein n=1 Tax=Polarella glacialis TaxID=89957 RepID=A0A813EAR1_POLGL|nr:unnamed protein product [Polarella glacialis]
MRRTLLFDIRRFVGQRSHSSLGHRSDLSGLSGRISAPCAASGSVRSLGEGAQRRTLNSAPQQEPAQSSAPPAAEKSASSASSATATATTTITTTTATPVTSYEGQQQEAIKARSKKLAESANRQQSVWNLVVPEMNWDFRSPMIPVLLLAVVYLQYLITTKQGVKEVKELEEVRVWREERKARRDAEDALFAPSSETSTSGPTAGALAVPSGETGTSGSTTGSNVGGA